MHGNKKGHHAIECGSWRGIDGHCAVYDTVRNVPELGF